MTLSDITYRAMDWVRKDLSADKNHFIQRQIFTRLIYVGLTPVATGFQILDGIVGSGSGIATIATRGKNSLVWKKQDLFLKRAGHILSDPFFLLLHALNPQAKFPRSHDFRVNLKGEGLLTAPFHEAIISRCRKFWWHSHSFIEKELYTRATYVVFLIGSLITRTIDLLIGAMAMAAAFATLGTIGSLNNMAYRGLQVFGILKDFFYGLAKVINPQAGVFERPSSD